MSCTRDSRCKAVVHDALCPRYTAPADRPRPLTAKRRCAYCGCAITAHAYTCRRCRFTAERDDVDRELAALERRDARELAALEDRC